MSNSIFTDELNILYLYWYISGNNLTVWLLEEWLWKYILLHYTWEIKKIYVYQSENSIISTFSLVEIYLFCSAKRLTQMSDCKMQRLKLIDKIVSILPGLEPGIPWFVVRCLIHWATGPVSIFLMFLCFIISIDLIFLTISLFILLYLTMFV